MCEITTRSPTDPPEAPFCFPRWPRKSFEFKPACDKWQTSSTSRIGRGLTAFCTADRYCCNETEGLMDSKRGFSSSSCFFSQSSHCSMFHECLVSMEKESGESALVRRREGRGLGSYFILQKRTRAFYVLAERKSIRNDRDARGRVAVAPNPRNVVAGRSIHLRESAAASGQKWSVMSELSGLIYGIPRVPTIMVGFFGPAISRSAQFCSWTVLSLLKFKVNHCLSSICLA